ncbi:unnamed protein product [Colias eurytheme]|nr:unnamed protein product [Colias eurytheme]
MYYFKDFAKFFGGSDDNDDSAVPKDNDNQISVKKSNHLPQNQIYTNNPEKELIPQKETVYENKPKEGFKDRAMDMFDEIPSFNGHKGKTYGMDLTGNHGTVWNDLSQTPVGIDSNQEPNSVLIDSNENKLNNDIGNQGNIWSGRNEVQPVSNEKIIITPVTDNGVEIPPAPKIVEQRPDEEEMADSDSSVIVEEPAVKSTEEENVPIHNTNVIVQQPVIIVPPNLNNVIKNSNEDDNTKPLVNNANSGEPLEDFKDKAIAMFNKMPNDFANKEEKPKTYGMDLVGNKGVVWNDLGETPVGSDNVGVPRVNTYKPQVTEVNNPPSKNITYEYPKESDSAIPVVTKEVTQRPMVVYVDKVPESKKPVEIDTVEEPSQPKPTEKPKENKHEPTNKEKPENQEKNPQKKPNEKKPDDFTKKDLDNLLNKKQFWDWLAGWTKKYMDLLNKRLKDMVKQEVANQLQKALHQNPETNNKNNAHGKDNQPKEKPKHENSTTEKPSHHSDDTKKNKEEPSNKSKPKRITEKNNKKDKYSPAEKSSKPKANNSDKPKNKNTSRNSKPEKKSNEPAHKSPASSNEDKEKPSESNGPSNNNNTSVDVHADTIYGNTVGKDHIKNVFNFYNGNGTNGNEGASNNKPANDNSNGDENKKADNSKEETPSSEESNKKDNDSNEKMKPKSKSFKSKEKPISENKKDKAVKPESNTEPSKEKEHRSDKSEADRRKPEARKEKPKESSESKKAAEPKKIKPTEEKKPWKPEESKSANEKKPSKPKESKRSTEKKPPISKESKPATKKKPSKSKESKPVRNLPNLKTKRNLHNLKNLKYLKKPASKIA